ncbi:inositol 1,4,5-trisphosphate receptor-interacting protein-like 1 isoform X2 [Cyanistes caeruleus]|uniref:inositol 1,4,5-trisphosphate receptor-interacting protein-like 1 isoform X2 n=1 Tax=Cyanistes caeruleus TaxID=156563 RepID=UPI000CDB4866|nr:inositol 1,4,5-trisphosphate receptor-interacting protein-like 1 isoform X2 [Cyanistes caeruleus]
MEMLLSFAWQHQCLLWASAAVLLLVLLAMGCWLVRRRKRGCDSCRELKCFKKYVMVASKEPSGEEQDLSSTKGLKELLDELLGVCRVLSRRNFMPELHLVAGTYSSCEVCSVQENSSTYRPLVLLRPPPGHSFILESTEHPPAGRVRVALECLCCGERLLGPRCFLHACGGQLPGDQEWYLLDTLCTGSYLDAEKVTRWVQMLVTSAWQLLPQSRHCRLTALPSGKGCSFQLSGTSGLRCSIEMALALEQGSSGAYLSLE